MVSISGPRCMQDGTDKTNLKFPKRSKESKSVVFVTKVSVIRLAEVWLMFTVGDLK